MKESDRNKLTNILKDIQATQEKIEAEELTKLEDREDDRLLAGMRVMIHQLGFQPCLGCVERNTALGPLKIKGSKIEGEYFKVECVLTNDSLLTHSGIRAILGHKMGNWDIKFSRKKHSDQEILKKIRSMFNDVISGTNGGEKPRY